LVVAMDALISSIMVSMVSMVTFIVAMVTNCCLGDLDVSMVEHKGA